MHTVYCLLLPKADPFPEEAWDEVQADPKKASDKHKDAYGM